MSTGRLYAQARKVALDSCLRLRRTDCVCQYPTSRPIANNSNAGWKAVDDAHP